MTTFHPEGVRGPKKAKLALVKHLSFLICTHKVWQRITKGVACFWFGLEVSSAEYQLLSPFSLLFCSYFVRLYSISHPKIFIRPHYAHYDLIIRFFLHLSNSISYFFLLCQHFSFMSTTLKKWRAFLLRCSKTKRSLSSEICWCLLLHVGEYFDYFSTIFN